LWRHFFIIVDCKIPTFQMDQFVAISDKKTVNISAITLLWELWLLFLLEKDKLKKPKKLKTVACTIEQATLQLNPTVEKFEEELCENLHEDRLGMLGKISDGTTMDIVERRLLVWFHWIPYTFDAAVWYPCCIFFSNEWR